MCLKKRECLLQSIERGEISWTLGLWFLLFLGVILCALMQMEAFRASSQYMEDALAASNLAAAVIDVREYGISHRLQIDSPEAAYERYRKALRTNLGLDDGWECGNRGLISGPVRIKRFIVYNVNGSEIDIYSFDENGVQARCSGIPGQERAPNGIKVESTGIYSEISYQINGIFGLRITARKGKLADVIKCAADELILPDETQHADRESN